MSLLSIHAENKCQINNSYIVVITWKWCLKCSLRECVRVWRVYICLYDLSRESWIAAGKYLEVYSGKYRLFLRILTMCLFYSNHKEDNSDTKKRSFTCNGVKGNHLQYKSEWFQIWINPKEKWHLVAPG